jgi:hypothetical protein
MRSGFVLTTVVLAIALGVIAGTSESRLLTRGLVVVFVPAIWAVSRLLERLRGRDIWRFMAPYPYRWMRDEGASAMARPRVRPKSKQERPDSTDRNAFPFAA